MLGCIMESMRGKRACMDTAWCTCQKMYQQSINQSRYYDLKGEDKRTTISQFFQSRWRKSQQSEIIIIQLYPNSPNIYVCIRDAPIADLPNYLGPIWPCWTWGRGPILRAVIANTCLLESGPSWLIKASRIVIFRWMQAVHNTLLQEEVFLVPFKEALVHPLGIWEFHF